MTPHWLNSALGLVMFGLSTFLGLWVSTDPIQAWIMGFFSASGLLLVALDLLVRRFLRSLRELKRG